MIIAGLAIGFSALSLAQGKAPTSIVSTMNNQSAVNNVAATPNNVAPRNDGGHSTGGDGGHSSGGDGGHTGGDDGHNPPNCVPEPATMLAVGLGAGILALKRRRASKVA